MFITALTSHYFKGFAKTIAFLIGLMSGYIFALILTLTGVEELVVFESVQHFFTLPEFAFLKFKNSPFEWKQLLDILLLFVPVAICALLEHYSDHKTLSNIIGTDLTQNPGLNKTLLGNGAASAVGTLVGGLPQTSYGEGVSVIGFSKVASVIVSTIAAIFLCLLAFIEPVRIFINSIPSCVFGGCAMILYGYIAASGLKTLFASKADLDNSKNLIIVSVILTVGVSGVFFLTESFVGVSLAMILGVILNLILKNKKEVIN